MIVSHKNKFIFIRTRKTASTSMELALRNFCGPDDIITPIQDMSIPVDRYYGMSCRNYKDHNLFLHERATRIKEVIGDDKFDSYYKFGFERNSYQKAISAYLYWQKLPDRNRWLGDEFKTDVPPDPKTIEDHVRLFTDFFNDRYCFGFGDQELYTDGTNNIIVDDIFQFNKNLSECFDILSDKLKINRDRFIVYSEKVEYSKGFDKSLLLNNKSIIKMIEEYYKNEIKHFGYKLEEA